jgi:hypothetical protein
MAVAKSGGGCKTPRLFATGQYNFYQQPDDDKMLIYEKE